MRVLHIQRAKGISGSERHLLTLLPALASAGVEVALCVLTVGDGDQFVRAARGEGLHVIPTRAGPDVNPALVARLVRIIHEQKPDIVHTHLVHADLHGLIAAAVTRTPSVSSQHTPPSYNRRVTYRWTGRLANTLTRRRIAISNHVAEHMATAQHARPGTVDVVPYGIDVDAWVDVAPLALPGVEAVGREDVVVVGVASRLVAGKGHDVLLDACELVADRAPSLRVVIAGVGELRTHLEQRVATLPTGTVQLLGFVSEMPAFMAACDALAFPTSPIRDEGFGFVALEAMAAGKPVLATAVGPIPEVVVDGVTGMLVEPDSPRALSEALLALVDDPARRRTMGCAGRERARQEFSVARMVERTVRVYEQVVA